MSNNCKKCGFFAELKYPLIFHKPEGYIYNVYGFCMKDWNIVHSSYPVYVKEGSCKFYTD